jgi:hypothetical protein
MGQRTISTIHHDGLKGAQFQRDLIGVVWLNNITTIFIRLLVIGLLITNYRH